jgi:hypothetical protein
VFYLCLHTVGLVRMEVVWVCFICVYIPWVWLGWRWCGCVLMYCSLFRNFTFCFYWFLFYFGLLVYICVVGCFPLGVYFNVCLFAYLFRLYSLFVFIYCLCYVTVLYHFFFERKRDYHILFVYWLIFVFFVVFLKISRNILCIN